MTTGTKTTADPAKTVREGTLALLEQLGGRGKALELPAAPEGLATYQRKLRENRYTVLVAGEAKRGKSSFVNALIGRELLPTGVEVTTSQVFRVRHAEREGYRVRFEDDSSRESVAADLPRYGSQVAEDAQGRPNLAQIIRWVEVDVPVRFLPEGMTLLDTPGLGSLYAAHAQITHRFVPEADAVIFVLDAKRPIIQAELDFLETILGVTRDVFFVLTKIDQHGRDAWETVQRRNREILAERFGDRLADTRVWPIASTYLLKAVAAENPVHADLYVLQSHHRELMDALQVFLFRVAGWRRAAEALILAEQHHAAGRQVLANRLAALTSPAKQAEVQQRAQQRKQQFEREWGPQGQQRQELQRALQQAITVGKKSVAEALAPGGAIDRAQRAKIDRLGTIAAVRQHGEVLAAEVAAAATEQWRLSYERTREKCVTLLAPFAEAAESLQAPVERGLISPTGAMRPGKNITDDLWRKISGARMETFAAGSIAYVGVTLLGAFVTVPAAPFIILAAAGWGVWKGWRDTQSKQLAQAQQELRAHLADVLQAARQEYLHVDAAAGRLSLLDEQFDGLLRAVNEHVQAVAKRKTAEAQGELTRLQEEAKLGEQQRKARAEQTQKALAGWDDLGRRLAGLAAELRALEQAPGPGAAAPAK